MVFISCLLSIDGPDVIQDMQVVRDLQQAVLARLHSCNIPLIGYQDNSDASLPDLDRHSSNEMSNSFFLYVALGMRLTDVVGNAHYYRTAQVDQCKNQIAILPCEGLRQIWQTPGMWGAFQLANSICPNLAPNKQLEKPWLQGSF